LNHILFISFRSTNFLVQDWFFFVDIEIKILNDIQSILFFNWWHVLILNHTVPMLGVCFFKFKLQKLILLLFEWIYSLLYSTLNQSRQNSSVRKKIWEPKHYLIIIFNEKRFANFGRKHQIKWNKFLKKFMKALRYTVIMNDLSSWLKLLIKSFSLDKKVEEQKRWKIRYFRLNHKKSFLFLKMKFRF
jgi:hypothetical protein